MAQELGGGADAPSIFTVLKEIGLRLEKGSYLVETITVDSAAYPLEN